VALSVLLILAAVAVGDPPRERAAEGTSVALGSPVAPQSGVVPEPLFQQIDLHYFHPTIRCVSCLTLEAVSAETVQDSFGAEIAAGRLSWQVHDFELPKNATLVDSFAIEGSTLIIAESLGGAPSRWEAVDHAWCLLETPDSLRGYVAAVVRAYLGTTR
jgi:hypothetical protein